MHNDAAYFALVEKYFARQLYRLRRDVDDKYAAYFEERIHRLESIGHSVVIDDLIKETRKLEDVARRKLTRRGLDVLCRKGRIEDAERIRENLESRYAGASECDAEYLGKHGKLVDITLLAAATAPSAGFLASEGNEAHQRAVARAANRIGRHSVSELMSLKLPGALLRSVVEFCGESRFAEVSDDALIGLLDHESAEVRRAATIKAVRSFPAKRLRSTLKEYLARDSYRYYNVIHWLDLGASMSREDARKVTAAASS